MLEYLRDKLAARDDLTATVNGITERAAGEGRDLTDQERAMIADMDARCIRIDADLDQYGKIADNQRAYAALRSHLSETTDDDRGALERVRPSAVATRGVMTRAPEPQGWGEAFVNSAAFQNYRGRGSSDEVELPGLFARAAADPILLATAGNYVPPTRHTPLDWTLATPLLDSLGRVSTNSNSVEWFRWGPTPFTAAPVVAEGAAKPPADITVTPYTDSLKTYAHWKAISRQALADIPQVSSIVERALRGGVLVALENAVGAALAAATGATGIPSITNTSLLAGIRIAVGQVQLGGYSNPNVVLLNPGDFANLDIAVMNTASIVPTMQANFWGMRAVPVASIPAGTAYVGDMQNAVTLFSRDTVSVYMSDSHEDFFVKNLIIILAEQRALVAVTNPAAAVRVTGATGAMAPVSGGAK